MKSPDGNYEGLIRREWRQCGVGLFGNIGDEQEQHRSAQQE